MTTTLMLAAAAALAAAAPVYAPGEVPAMAEAAKAAPRSVVPVLRGWVRREREVVTILAGDRAAAWEIKEAIEPNLHPRWNAVELYSVVEAKTHPGWTAGDLAAHLDRMLAADSPGIVTVVYPNARFEATPAVRAKVSALRAKGRLALFMEYGEGFGGDRFVAGLGAPSPATSGGLR